jgi:predicted amidohydrolase
MVGFPEAADGDCFNSLAVIEKGKITKVYRKALRRRQVNSGG